MIARLRGLLVEVDGEDAVVDVAGVGYLVRCGARTLARLPATGEETTLLVESQTSQEGGTRLYGFLTRDERSAFRLLQGVQGVGPKAALSVLDVLAPAELAAAVLREDKAAVGRANGVGPKLAQRIVVELKDKPLGGGIAVPAAAAPGAADASPPGGAAREAVLALVGLAIPEPTARRAVETAQGRDPDLALEALIRAALREVAR